MASLLHVIWMILLAILIISVAVNTCGNRYTASAIQGVFLCRHIHYKCCQASVDKAVCPTIMALAGVSSCNSMSFLNEHDFFTSGPEISESCRNVILANATTLPEHDVLSRLPLQKDANILHFPMQRSSDGIHANVDDISTIPLYRSSVQQEPTKKLRFVDGKTSSTTSSRYYNGVDPLIDTTASSDLFKYFTLSAMFLSIVCVVMTSILVVIKLSTPLEAYVCVPKGENDTWILSILRPLTPW